MVVQETMAALAVNVLYALHQAQWVPGPRNLSLNYTFNSTTFKSHMNTANTSTETMKIK